jgi:hypothetical protein
MYLRQSFEYLRTSLVRKPPFIVRTQVQKVYHVHEVQHIHEVWHVHEVWYVHEMYVST